MSDEREQRPSASIIDRLAKCPGSWRLSRLAPEATGSPDAESGTRIHEALATRNPGLLGDDESTLAIEILALGQELVGEWIGDHEPDQTLREERLWRVRDGQRLWSAKADLIHVAGPEALIIEYKTGPIAVEPASGNLQLRAQAVAVSERFPELHRIIVAVVQPRSFPRVSRCVYGRRELERARDQIDRIVDRAGWEDATVVPGEAQCRYCAGKVVCPKAQEAVSALAKVEPLPLTGPTLAAALDRCLVAEKVIEAIRDEARNRLAQDAGAVPGWRLAPGRPRETITDLQTVFERLHGLGAKPEQFTGACSLTKKALKGLLKEVTQEAGGLLDARLETVIEGCVSTSTGSPVLAREKHP